ncbi:MAG: RES family NAD+ phosphorylase [Gemmataceae bacterium]|nr:RES family NAD+ phosphorylase [Gemmataceae bacterium]
MYHPIGQGTPLYRVTSLSEAWPNPLLGLGAYFTQGGRYNRPQQQTVYTSDDPLVAITEAAFYQALNWHRRLALHRFLPVAYPLESEHWLWCFTLDPAPPVIDLLHANAQHAFPHPPHLLLTPSQQYEGTQGLADHIRAYLPPDGSAHPRPEGLRAPSVRTPHRGTFQPAQFVLFVMNPAFQQP